MLDPEERERKKMEMIRGWNKKRKPSSHHPTKLCHVAMMSRANSTIPITTWLGQPRLCRLALVTELFQQPLDFIWVSLQRLRLNDSNFKRKIDTGMQNC